MDKKYLQLNDIEAYKIAFHLSNYIWDIIGEWEWFAKKTLGSQFVNAAEDPALRRLIKFTDEKLKL